MVWSCCAKSSKACGQEVGVDPLTAVLDGDLQRLGHAAHADRDDARLKSELCGVDDEVGECLSEPARVAAHIEPLVRHIDIEAMLAGVDLLVAARHRTLHDALDRHAFAHERDLPLRRARHVDQFLHQATEPADLALEDLAQADQDRVAVLDRAQHTRRIGDGRQRIAQLVREHRQELTLATFGEPQGLGALGKVLLECLAFVNVDGTADVAGGLPGVVEAWNAGVGDPAVFAVLPTQPVVHAEWRRCLEARGPDAGTAVGILGVDAAQPAVAEQRIHAPPGELRPGGAVPVVPSVGRGAPDEDGRSCRDGGEVGRVQMRAHAAECSGRTTDGVRVPTEPAALCRFSKGRADRPRRCGGAFPPTEALAAADTW